ncbi:MAG: peptidoglycan-binding protein LysM [Robiginitomaculum sp.]|nr:MAG: peptidoglycan-binding protein LysM [Robiginitomaculum sp.]
MSATRGFIIAAVIAVIAAVVVITIQRTGKTPGPAPGPAVQNTQNNQNEGALVGPSFDIVRVDMRGTAVIAGRAEPNSKITLEANGKTIAQTTASSNGDWTIILNDPLEPGAIEFSLLMEGEDGRVVRSDQVVVVSVPRGKNKRPLVVLGRPGGPSRVLQSPDDDKETGPLALEAVDYDRAGGVIFSGRALPGSGIRVLADGQLLGQTRANEQGRWVLDGIEPLAPGVYDLQIDQVGPDGHVSAVIALPFERTSPQAITDAPPGSVIVQPGNSLWRIARRLYGSGWQYTIIYRANAGKIRDADLIYPGQVFSIPDTETSQNN